MKYKAHTIGAVAFSFVFINLNKNIGLEINPIFFIGGAVVGGLLPDMDHPKSLLGSIVQPLSTIIKETIGHRTFTHSILFTLIIGFFISFFNINFGFGIGLGMLSHIILDLLTPNTYGVAFLYPFYKKKIRIL